MKFTVLGASGFIGSHLLAHLRQSGHECFTPGRGDPAVFSHNLGHVVYCIGLTADFRTRPFDTVRAHVCFLSEVLEKARFESLLYLSSTRVYAGTSITSEDAVLLAGDLYNLSKLVGESLCLASGREGVRVARLSNVFGGDFDSDNFLTAVIRNAVQHAEVVLSTSLDSAKDYVSIDNVVSILPKIAVSGKHRVYNVASGRNTSSRELIEKLHELTGCSVRVSDEASLISFAPIEITRLHDEFGFSAAMVLDCMDELVKDFRQDSNEGK